MNKKDEVIRMAVDPQPGATMNIDEAAAFLGLRKSYIYKLTHLKEIPFIKYGGRLILFDRERLTAWKRDKMQSVPTREELASMAEVYCANNPLQR